MEDTILTADDIKALSQDKLIELAISQNNTIAEQLGTIANLNSIIAAAPAAAQKTSAKTASKIPDAFEHKGKQYVFTMPSFRLPGRPDSYTAEEAMNDKAILDEILKIPEQSLLVAKA